MSSKAETSLWHGEDAESPQKQMDDPPTSPELSRGSNALPETGHTQELVRNFSLWSLAGNGLLVCNTWPALGGSILVAIYNGGPPGVVYEFIVASAFYCMIAASLAELASAMPSSAGPYLWASITPGKTYGRSIGFFAGWWNALAWVFAAASISAIGANIAVQMYAASNPSFTVKSWHVFVTYLIVAWGSCAVVCLFNSSMPKLNKFGIFITLAGALTTIMVCALMPSIRDGPGHSSSRTVWLDWTADIGYPSGFVFLAGLLNGSYAMGTPDSCSHLAEEIPNPSKYVPIAVAMQYAIGFLSGFTYLIAILYTINDYDALYHSSFPIAEIYRQATESTAGTIGLLTLLLIPTIICDISVFITCGRTVWALSRDGATPFTGFLSRVHPKLKVPVNATISCCALVTVLGCIYLGSVTTFNAFVGCYVLMSMSSYIASLLPYLLRGRQGVRLGYFRLPHVLGLVLNSLACAFMLVCFVIFCFPYSLPTDAKTMNYTSLIWGGLTLFVGLWWVFRAKARYGGIAIPLSQAEALMVHGVSIA